MHKFHTLAYVGAVSTSCGIAYTLNNYAKKVQERPNVTHFMRGVMRGVVPFVAIVLAGCVNLLMIRHEELISGVAVFDEYASWISFLFSLFLFCLRPPPSLLFFFSSLSLNHVSLFFLSLFLVFILASSFTFAFHYHFFFV